MDRKLASQSNAAARNISLHSSDERLNKGFAWAKEQALSYAHEGDPVGKWYEAALPGRESFCVRDVSHQSSGAYMLGLKEHTKNMLSKFAEHISGSRDWCTYWEMNRHDLPTPVDYTDDSDFWYNLPANFDFMFCCFKEYLRTGDSDYMEHPDFARFYDKTLTDYIAAWDKDGDGIPEHYAHYGRRGIASYVEDGLHPFVAGDLLAAQYAAYAAYAEMELWRGEEVRASEWLRKADQIRRNYNESWWNETTRRFNGCKLQDGAFHEAFYQSANYLPLYFGLVSDSSKLRHALEDIIGFRGYNVEEKSHLPEIGFRYGRNEDAYRILLELTDENLKRREYPEVSFSVVGAVCTGLLGLELNARNETVTTLPGLPETLSFVNVDSIPLFDGEIDVSHVGNHSSVFANRSGRAVRWIAKFPGHYEYLYINGEKSSPLYDLGWDGKVISLVSVEVKAGETARVHNSHD